MDINQNHLDQAADQFEALLLKPRGDKLIRLNISRNTLIAIVFSLLLHALILLMIVPKIQFNNPSAPLPTSMEVSLAAPTPPKEEVPVLPEPEPEKPEPQAVKPPTKVMTQKPNKQRSPSTFSVPDVIAAKQPTPELVPPKESAKDAPTDMASYVKAQQAKRNAVEADAAKQNAEAVAREIGPSEDEKRNQRISKNLNDGPGGMFSSPNINGVHATFSFNGWVGLGNQRREFFEVEAKPNEDIKLLVIKRMIRVIREKKSGDFPWESQRLGREIVKSARPEDNAELEEFLMMEIFGSNYKNTAY